MHFLYDKKWHLFSQKGYKFTTIQTRTLVIMISKDRVFLNPRISIPLSQTNIPAENLMFNPNTDFLWMVEMDGFDRENKILEYR